MASELREDHFVPPLPNTWKYSTYLLKTGNKCSPKVVDAKSGFRCFNTRNFFNFYLVQGLFLKHKIFFSKIIQKSLTLCCLQFSTVLGVHPNSFHGFHRVLLRNTQHSLLSFPQYNMIKSNMPCFHLSNTPLGAFGSSA